MAGPFYFDRVKETSTTTASGDFSLLGSAVGFQPFSGVLSVNDQCYYGIENPGLNEWEAGVATYGSGNLLLRTNVYNSSQSNNKVNFSAGTKNCWINFPAKQASCVMEEDPFLLMGG